MFLVLCIPFTQSPCSVQVLPFLLHISVGTPMCVCICRLPSTPCTVGFSPIQICSVLAAIQPHLLHLHAHLYEHPLVFFSISPITHQPTSTKSHHVRSLGLTGSHWDESALLLCVGAMEMGVTLTSRRPVTSLTFL